MKLQCEIVVEMNRCSLFIPILTLSQTSMHLAETRRLVDYFFLTLIKCSTFVAPISDYISGSSFQIVFRRELLAKAD